MITKLKTNALRLLILTICISPRIPLPILIPGRRVDLRLEDIILLLMVFYSFLYFCLRPRFFTGYLGRPIGFYIGIAIISSCIGLLRIGDASLPRAVFYLFKEIEYFSLFFILVNFIKKETEIKTCVKMLLIGGILNVLWVGCQILMKYNRPLVVFNSPLGVYEPRNLLACYGPNLIGEPSPLSTACFLHFYFSIIRFHLY